MSSSKYNQLLVVVAILFANIAFFGSTNLVFAKQNGVFIVHVNQGQGDEISFAKCMPISAVNGHKHHAGDSIGGVCELDTEPTAQPSATPKPTEQPTIVPTAKPTDVPQPSATPKPTEQPTIVPTAKTTDVPQPSATQKPTEQPTIVPTAKPTDVPQVRFAQQQIVESPVVCPQCCCCCCGVTVTVSNVITNIVVNNYFGVKSNESLTETYKVLDSKLGSPAMIDSNSALAESELFSNDLRALFWLFVILCVLYAIVRWVVQPIIQYMAAYRAMEATNKTRQYIAEAEAEATKVRAKAFADFLNKTGPMI